MRAPLLVVNQRSDRRGSVFERSTTPGPAPSSSAAAGCQQGHVLEQHHDGVSAAFCTADASAALDPFSTSGVSSLADESGDKNAVYDEGMDMPLGLRSASHHRDTLAKARCRPSCRATR